MRVAIVGLGPKGLYALERLFDHARDLDPVAGLEIDVFEPHPVPGAGPVYDPRQPEYLLMNFAAAHVDMWWPGSGVVPPDERRSYVEWSGTDPWAYPSRSDVGRYLADGLDRLRRRAPDGVSLRLHRSAVAAVSARGRHWAVSASGETTLHDEVLIAIGHQSSWAGELASPLSVYPVQRRLSPDRVPPGSNVAVRGFALTFIDAALALTEGRGGVFEKLDHPYRLRYHPSRDDVGQIIPHSRTGRPMRAKPGPELAADDPRTEAILESGRRRIRELGDTADAVTGLTAIVTAAATAALTAAGGDTTPAASLDPVDEMERSLAVGAGHIRPDPAWALGHVWRGVYPAIVTRFSGRVWAPGEVLRFRRLSAEMERVAFGPAPVNTAKILALIDAGRINLDHLREPPVGHVDAVVDAVLPPPGARGLRTPLLEQLVRDGHARVVAGGRGLEVTADAACVGRSGSPSPGLSAIGRPTEDSVVGNDTLSRTLHPQADRWARRILGRREASPEAAMAQWVA
ncbi:MAG: FAD/NAD(P)-binding protein [Gaiellales bacterium]